MEETRANNRLQTVDSVLSIMLRVYKTYGEKCSSKMSSKKSHVGA